MRDTKYGAFIKANFQALWPAHLSGFTQLLVQLRHRFDGDLDLALVLAVIGSRTQAAYWKPELTELSRLSDGEFANNARLPINIQSIAGYSGIPRETVRRKVAILQDRGWVTRATDGSLTVTPAAACDLQDATGDTIAYLAALLRALETAQDKETVSSSSAPRNPTEP